MTQFNLLIVLLLLASCNTPVLSVSEVLMENADDWVSLELNQALKAYPKEQFIPIVHSILDTCCFEQQEVLLDPNFNQNTSQSKYTCIGKDTTLITCNWRNNKIIVVTIQ